MFYQKGSNSSRLIQNNSIFKIQQNDLTILVENLKPKKQFLLKTLDHFLNLTFLTPIVIFYWSSTWNIYYLNIFPNYFWLSCICTFVISNLLLLFSYLFQYELQAHHTKLFEKNKNNSSQTYYNTSFLFRCIYTYILTLAYVAQWRTYWDIYNYFTIGVNYKYFLAISILTLIFYRYILKNSFKNYIKTCPFHMQMDTKFGEFFIQSKIIEYKNVNNLRLISLCFKLISLVNIKLFKKRLEQISNFCYFEIVDMLLSVFAWKGIWDLLDVGAENLMSALGFVQTKLVSIYFTCAFGYTLYIFLILIEKLLVSVRFFRIKYSRSLFVQDLFYILSYFSMVAVWRTFWSGYDYFCLQSAYKQFIIFSTHLACFFLVCLLKLGSSLYGPAGLTSFIEDDNQNNRAHDSKTQKLLEIEYFSSF